MAHHFNLANERKSLSQSLELAVRSNKGFSVSERDFSITFDPKQLGSGVYYERLGQAQAKFITMLESDLDERYKNFNYGLELIMDIERKAKFTDVEEEAFAIKALRLYFTVTFPLLHFKTFGGYVKNLISEKEKIVSGEVKKKITFVMGKRLLEGRLKYEGAGNKSALPEVVANQKTLVYLQSRIVDAYVKEIHLSKCVYNRMYQKEN